MLDVSLVLGLSLRLRVQKRKRKMQAEKIKILVDLDASVLQSLLLAAQAAGVSLDTHINNRLAETKAAQLTLRDYVKRAVERLQARPLGEVKAMHELFSAAEWVAIPHHRVLGRMFRQELESMAVPVAEFKQKDAAGHAQYIRK